MRERLDCAVLAFGQDDWLEAVTGSRLGGRLALHRPAAAGGSPSTMLADPILARGRYDAAVIHVDASSLGAWRMALSAHAANLTTLLLVYAVGLRAQAVGDLFRLGVADFMRPPFCPEELRARVENLLSRHTPLRVAEVPPSYGAPSVQAGALTETSLCDTILQRSGAELEAYAVALATRRATSRTSFRAAKGEVVARFERAYIRAALGRHGGNITLAARDAQKHRRAFWALMRKHDIDPAPYRAERTPAAPDAPPGPGR